MVKTKITETTEKYDSNGVLMEKTVREETSEDDTVYPPYNWSSCVDADYISANPLIYTTASNGCGGGHEC